MGSSNLTNYEDTRIQHKIQHKYTLVQNAAYCVQVQSNSILSLETKQECIQHARKQIFRPTATIVQGILWDNKTLTINFMVEINPKLCLRSGNVGIFAEKRMKLDKAHISYFAPRVIQQHLPTPHCIVS